MNGDTTNTVKIFLNQLYKYKERLSLQDIQTKKYCHTLERTCLDVVWSVLLVPVYTIFITGQVLFMVLLQTGKTMVGFVTNFKMVRVLAVGSTSKGYLKIPRF